MSKFKSGKVKKDLSAIGPPAGIEPTPARDGFKMLLKFARFHLSLRKWDEFENSLYENSLYEMK